MRVLLITRLFSAVSGKVGPVSLHVPVHQTSWMAIVTPTDSLQLRPRSVRNRVIELLVAFLCGHFLSVWHFCWYVIGVISPFFLSGHDVYRLFMSLKETCFKNYVLQNAYFQVIATGIGFSRSSFFLIQDSCRKEIDMIGFAHIWKSGFPEYEKRVICDFALKCPFITMKLK